MSPGDTERYQDRFRKVLAYIDAHLGADLSVERLSRIAAFSQYHFHRQFSGFMGIGLYRYIQLRRLKRASYQLAFRHEQPIVDIALASGYGSPEAFARAFRKIIGQSPSAFRSAPEWISWHTTYRQLEPRGGNVVPPWEPIGTVTFRDTRVAALEYRGDPRQIGEALRTFIAWRRENRLGPRVSDTFNIVYHHPADGDDGDCHYDLCASTERALGESSLGIVAKVIPGGRCAMLRYRGPEEGLGESVRHLYTEWLPRSGEELRDFPLYFQRMSFFPDVPEHEATTDVYLPLK
jgi:AraC family transcriptional regulator